MWRDNLLSDPYSTLLGLDADVMQYSQAYEVGLETGEGGFTVHQCA
jgi:hypothetical protein